MIRRPVLIDFVISYRLQKYFNSGLHGYLAIWLAPHAHRSQPIQQRVSSDRLQHKDSWINFD